MEESFLKNKEKGVKKKKKREGNMRGKHKKEVRS